MKPPAWLPRVAALMLLGLHALLAVTSMARKAPTFDEVSHIAAGYAYVRTGEMHLNPEHPPLAKVLAGLPLLLLDLDDPRDAPEFAAGDQWGFGKRFLFANRTGPDRIVFLARLPMVLLSLALGVLVWRWAAALFGTAGGLVALALHATSPHFLAHGRLVTTDVPVTLFSMLAMHALWRGLADPPGGRHWWLYGAALAGAFLSKYSAIVLLPCVVAVALGAAWTTPATADVRRRTALRLGVATAVPLALVALFGFGPGEPLRYLFGFFEGFDKLARQEASQRYNFYLAGMMSETGFYSYYAVAFLVKSPIPALVLLAASLPALRRLPAMAWLSLLVPAALFFLAPTLRRYNIGVRYMMPAIGFLIVMSGGAAAWLGHPRRGVATVARVVTVGLLLWGGVAMGIVHPHYIPYANEAAGGPAATVDWLDDSNVDWGQERGAFRSRVRRRGGLERGRRPLPRTGARLPLPSGGPGGVQRGGALAEAGGRLRRERADRPPHEMASEVPALPDRRALDLPLPVRRSGGVIRSGAAAPHSTSFRPYFFTL